MTDSDPNQRDEETTATPADVTDTETTAQPAETAPEAPAAEAPAAEAAAEAPAAEPTAEAPAAEAAAPAAEAPAAEAAVSAAEAPAAEAAAPAAGAAGDEEASGAGAEGSAEGQTAEAGEGKKKKKRRRRKKKKPEGAEGAEGAESKPHHQAPFAKYFEGGHGKKHAFTAGEVIAGRVATVEKGTISVDLFGKATAFVDVLEPRDIPIAPPPEPKPEPAAPAEATAAPEAAAETPAEATAAPEAAAETPEAAAAPEPEPEPAPDAAAGPEVPAPAPEPPPEPPELGAIFRGRVGSVAESGHIAIVNRLVDRAAAKASIRLAHDEHRRLEGLVYGFNRGGFDVMMEGVRVFCPASAMSLTPIDDPHPFLGQKIEFSISPTKGGGKAIIVSRRSILEKELRKLARERLKKLIVGERMKGKVHEIRDYGLLVDIGEGVEGLVHQSEVSWNRGDRPADVAKVGDEVEVEVLKITPASRKDRFGRVSLSIRACLPDPWGELLKTMKEGTAQKGTITRTTDFGAFVQLAPGVEGLAHISELGGKDVKHANQVVKEGDEMEVVIERIDRQNRKISLSRLSPSDAKAIESGEFDPSKAPKSLKSGAHIDVIVDRVEHHGLFVQVAGVLGRRGRGYISNRDLGEVDGGDKRRTFAPGTTLNVKITGTDRRGELRCSLKALQIDEERKAVKDYRREAAKQGFGTFGDILKAKLEKGDD